jgi:2-amino-4-hydroxy-6-hydroxymethyldihydropteridine diphosphokinase
VSGEPKGSAHRGVGVRAFLGLGANLGDRLANLQRAVELLDTIDGVDVIASSRVYETTPVGPPQPYYLNAVIEASTLLSARGLLGAGRSVEEALGRIRGERWGPRVIDVDLLTFGHETIAEPDLTVPHPRMHERGFVLVPLLELEADPPLPGGRTIGSIRLERAGVGSVRLCGPALANRSSG